MKILCRKEHVYAKHEIETFSLWNKLGVTVEGLSHDVVRFFCWMCHFMEITDYQMFLHCHCIQLGQN